MNKIKIAQAVIVEGRYDRAVLESVIDAVIIPVNGFGIFKDKGKLAMIRLYAETTGVIIMTDSDDAGRQIRNFIKNCLRNSPKSVGKISDVYVPSSCDSPEVEDTAVDVLRKVFEQFAATSENTPNSYYKLITREDLFDFGIIGCENCVKKRKRLLKGLDLPENLSVNALIDVLNRCQCDYERILRDI